MLDTNNLKPFIQPRVDLKKYKKNEPVEVEVKINLEPEIKLKDFQKIEINKYEIDLNKSLVEKNYNEFLSNQKKYSPIKNNREIKKSDKVIINLLSIDETVEWDHRLKRFIYKKSFSNSKFVYKNNQRTTQII